MNQTNGVIRAVDLQELVELQTICKETYSIYFGEYWVEKGLELYLENQFGSKRLEQDLLNNKILYYFILDQSKKVGFMKINLRPSHDYLNSNEAAELEKMYLYPEYKGKGIGEKALKESIKTVREIGKKIIFLDVLDSNLKAMAFYEKIGFKFHVKTKVGAPFFKEELNGLCRMKLDL